MIVSKNTLVTVELHLHTRASKDSLVQPDRLLRHCKRIGVDKVAVTDHNEIAGALELKAMAPEHVIVAEEIKTTEGELIGYFMTEWIPPGLEPMEVITRLREQGAVITVPHPFDKDRGPKWSEAELLSIASHVDAIEVFNARCLTNKPNQKAAAFARDHNLLATVGSDAHSLFEVGRATLTMPDFNDAGGFKKSLQQAQPRTRLSPAFVRLFSRYAAGTKRFKSRFF